MAILIEIPLTERILICGDRNWNDPQMVFHVLEQLKSKCEIEVVIEGECRGADAMGRNAALALGIPVLPFFAQWRTFNKAAGPIRNTQMLQEGKPTLVLAFHDDYLASRGTHDMITKAILYPSVNGVLLYSHAPHSPSQLWPF